MGTTCSSLTKESPVFGPTSNDDFDPVGSVSIIDFSKGYEKAIEKGAKTVGFEEYDGSENELREMGVRIFPGKNASQDFEPEYITVTDDSETAFVSLQENNAVVKIDIEKKKIIDILPLGLQGPLRRAVTV